MHALIQWNAETLNIYTMICGLGLSCICFITIPISIPSSLIFISCLLHNPYSVTYHIHCSAFKHDWTKWKNDVSAIFIAGIPLTAAMALSTLPFPIALTYTAFTATIAISYRDYYMSRTPEDLENLDYHIHSMHIAAIIACFTFPMVIGTLIAETRGRKAAFCGVVASLFIGGVLYAKKIPESWYPQTKITCGTSNHIMHVCIIIAHVCHYMYLCFT